MDGIPTVMDAKNKSTDFELCALGWRPQILASFWFSADVSMLEHEITTASSLISTFPQQFAGDLAQPSRLIKIWESMGSIILVDFSPSFNTLTRSILGLSTFGFSRRYRMSSLLSQSRPLSRD